MHNFNTKQFNAVKSFKHHISYGKINFLIQNYLLNNLLLNVENTAVWWKKKFIPNFNFQENEINYWVWPTIWKNVFKMGDIVFY